MLFNFETIAALGVVSVMTVFSVIALTHTKMR